MSALAATQAAMQAWLLQGEPGIAMSVDGDAAAQRLRIYADAYRLRLLEVLGNDFPICKTVLGDEAFDALAAHFDGSPLVSVSRAGDESELLLRKSDEATDRMELMLYASPDGTQIRLVARLDNLGKGASGACVQNLNIMAGLPETAGLRI